MLLSKNPTTGFWTDLGKGFSLVHVHPASNCMDRGCAIHDHPSTHPLMDAPMNWREDRGILERLCMHGVSHPDRDSALYLESIGKSEENVHGCDGCCGGMEF